MSPGSGDSSSSTVSATPTSSAPPEVEGFLSSLAVEGRVSAATQSQALAAILFLYRDVLGADLPWMEGIAQHGRGGGLTKP